MTLLFNSRETAAAHKSISFKTFLPVTKGRLQITAAFKGEESFDLATVRFELDGTGGYLGAERISPGQFRGDGTLKKGEVRAWEYDLSSLKVAWDDKNGSRPVDFIKLLNARRDHTVSCWVSGGKESTVTVKLILE